MMDVREGRDDNDGALVAVQEAELRAVERPQVPAGRWSSSLGFRGLKFEFGISSLICFEVRVWDFVSGVWGLGCRVRKSAPS